MFSVNKEFQNVCSLSKNKRPFSMEKKKKYANVGYWTFTAMANFNYQKIC